MYCMSIKKLYRYKVKKALKIEVPGRSIDCVPSRKTTSSLSSQKACDCSKLFELAVESIHSTAHIVGLSRLFSKSYPTMVLNLHIFTLVYQFTLIFLGYNFTLSCLTYKTFCCIRCKHGFFS